MQEIRPVAFKFFGEVSQADHLQGLARVMLGWVRDQLAPLNLKVGKRSMTLPDGTYIEVTVVGDLRTAYIYAPGFPKKELEAAYYNGIFILQAGTQTTATIIDYGVLPGYVENANAKLPWYVEQTGLSAPIASSNRVYWIGDNPKWSGPGSQEDRYATLSWFTTTSSPDVYKLGRPIVRAPADVYGTGLFHSWIIVVCYESASNLKTYYKRFPTGAPEVPRAGEGPDLSTDIFDPLLSDEENFSRWREVTGITLPNPYTTSQYPLYRYVSFKGDGSKCVWYDYDPAGAGTKYTLDIAVKETPLSGEELEFTYTEVVVPDSSNGDSSGYFEEAGTEEIALDFYWKKIGCSGFDDFTYSSSVQQSGFWYARVYTTTWVSSYGDGGLAEAQAYVESFIVAGTSRDHIIWNGKSQELNTETYRYTGTWYDQYNVSTGTAYIYMTAIYRWTGTSVRNTMNRTISLVGGVEGQIKPVLGYFYDGDSEVELTYCREVRDNNTPSATQIITTKVAEAFTWGPQCISESGHSYLQNPVGASTYFDPSYNPDIQTALTGTQHLNVQVTQTVNAAVDLEVWHYWKRTYLDGEKVGTVYKTLLRYEQEKFSAQESMAFEYDTTWIDINTASSPSITKTPISASGSRKGHANYTYPILSVPVFCPYSPTQMAIETSNYNPIGENLTDIISFTLTYAVEDSEAIAYTRGSTSTDDFRVYTRWMPWLDYSSAEYLAGTDETTFTYRDHRNLVVLNANNGTLHDFGLNGYDFSSTSSPVRFADYWITGTTWGKDGDSDTFYIAGYPGYTYVDNGSYYGRLEAVTSPDGDSIYDFNSLGTGGGLKVAKGLFAFDDPTFDFQVDSLGLASTGAIYPSTFDDVMCIGRRVRTYSPEE